MKKFFIFVFIFFSYCIATYTMEENKQPTSKISKKFKLCPTITYQDAVTNAFIRNGFPIGQLNAIMEEQQAPELQTQGEETTNSKVTVNWTKWEEDNHYFGKSGWKCQQSALSKCYDTIASDPVGFGNSSKSDLEKFEVSHQEAFLLLINFIKELSQVPNERLLKILDAHSKQVD